MFEGNELVCNELRTDEAGSGEFLRGDENIEENVGQRNAGGVVAVNRYEGSGQKLRWLQQNGCQVGAGIRLRTEVFAIKVVLHNKRCERLNLMPWRGNIFAVACNDACKQDQ